MNVEDDVTAEIRWTVLWFSEKGNKPKHTLGLTVHTGSSVHSVYVCSVDIMQPQAIRPPFCPTSAFRRPASRKDWHHRSATPADTHESLEKWTERKRRGSHRGHDCAISLFFLVWTSYLESKAMQMYIIFVLLLWLICCFFVCFHSTLLRWTNIVVKIQKKKKSAKEKKQDYFSMEAWKPALGGSKVT